MPSYIWTQDLVRCPVDRLLVNVTSSPSPLSSRFLSGSGGDIAQIRRYFGLDLEPIGLDIGDLASGSSSYITIALACETLLCLLLVAWRFHGVSLLEMDHGTGRRQARRQHSPLTSNTMWLAYFAVQAAMHATSAVTIGVHRWHEETELQRMLVLLQRVLLGLTSLILVTALNNHRLDKIRDHAKASASSALKRQAKVMNLGALCVFFVIAVSYFVSSHIIDDENSSAARGMYFVYIAALVLISLPPLFATFWIVFHDAQLQPSRLAKAALAIAVAQRLVTVYPPSLWNLHLLSSWVSRSPCPFVGGNLSFYDAILLMHLVSNGLLVLFVGLEHQRNARSSLAEHYVMMSQQLEDAISASESGTPASTPGRGKPGAINS